MLDKIKAQFNEAILEAFEAKDMPVVVCQRDSTFALLKFLRYDSDFDFNLLTDLTAVDYLKYPQKQPKRYAVVYHLYSLEKKHRLRVKVSLGSDSLTIESVIPLWKTANWLEREVYDMYGIHFENHPNLKRILNHIEFVGHPLRKDYPIQRRQILTINDSLVDEMEKCLKEKGLK